jgi:hypothetical protein
LGGFAGSVKEYGNGDRGERESRGNRFPGGCTNLMRKD